MVSPQPPAVMPAIGSLILPGLGQYSRGEWFRGSFFLAAEGFLAADAFYHWEKAEERPAWDDAGRIFDQNTAYSLAVWYSTGALFTALDAFYANKPERIDSPTLAALMSVLFPGLGQLANGKRWKAAIMFAMQTGLAFSVYYQHNNYLYYDALGGETEARFYKDNRNRLIWWSVGAVIFSAADAFVDCHLRGWTVSEDLALIPLLDPNNGAFGVNLSLSLSKP